MRPLRATAGDSRDGGSIPGSGRSPRRSPKRRGSLRCLPPLEVRPSSVAPDPAPQLEQFLGRVLEASNYGVSVLSNASGNWNWDFTSALFFASTVLSTTGRRPAPRPRLPIGPSIRPPLSALCPCAPPALLAGDRLCGAGSRRCGLRTWGWPPGALGSWSLNLQPGQQQGSPPWAAFFGSRHSTSNCPLGVVQSWRPRGEAGADGNSGAPRALTFFPPASRLGKAAEPLTR